MSKIFSAVLVYSLVSLVAVASEPAALVLSDSWVRALPPGQPNTAAYLTAANPGATTVTIVGASAAVADKAEIHTTRQIDGMQRMEQLAQVQVAPGQSLVLAPGGTHLMLLGLSRMPAPGDEVRLCLLLAGDGEVCTIAPVRKSAGGDQSHDHHQH